jgi:hypothetical protein
MKNEDLLCCAREVVKRERRRRRVGRSSWSSITREEGEARRERKEKEDRTRVRQTIFLPSSVELQ